MPKHQADKTRIPELGNKIFNKSCVRVFASPLNPGAKRVTKNSGNTIPRAEISMVVKSNAQNRLDARRLFSFFSFKET